MIVCSCNVLSDHDVRGVVATRDADLTPAQIYGGLACRPQCGTCARTIRAIIRETSVSGETPGR
jgi:bacterioferritin-associated ferredoxin